MKKLLLIVDPQIDFITGTLPVAGAAEAMDALAKYVKEKGNEYTVKIVTADWHPYHHSSFADEGGWIKNKLEGVKSMSFSATIYRLLA